ncbi:MFS transporter [Lonepinella koalarum]|uniref:MFS transporter n=1 Tax=Lonepinella koalarum TaxID=53417 RepID=UPI0011E4BA6D|nr:MFS transporter [Lonepinella koalarum]TYG34328.1 MFS transporter [Lonepinella koalarum]
MYSKFRWFVLFVMFIVTASTSLILIAPVTIVDSISSSSHLAPPTIITASMSTFNLFIVLSVMAGGILVDKFGVTKIYVLCLALVICGNVVMANLGNEVWGIFLSRAFQGLGTGPIMVSITLVARQWFKQNEHGIVTGLQGMAVSIGIAIGFVLVPRLVTYVEDWGTVFYYLSLINLTGIVLTLIVIFCPKLEPVELDVPSPMQQTATEFKLLQPLVLIGVVSLFCSTWLQQSVNSVGAGFIGTELGLGQIHGADLMFYYSIAYAIGSPLGGAVAGIWLKGQKDNLVILVCFLISAIFSFVITQYTETAGLIICLLILGLFQSFISPIILSFIARTYPKEVIGKVSGFTMMFNFAAGILSPYACALLLSTLGTYSSSFIAMIAVSIIGALVGFKLKVKNN